MRYYPIFVNLARKKCLVVGAGQVGRRKIATLASCGAAEILVLDLSPLGPESAAILEHPCVRFERRAFAPADLDDRFLVIASTSDEDTNWRISRLCEQRGIPCNIVAQPEKCSFIVPALFTPGRSDPGRVHGRQLPGPGPQDPPRPGGIFRNPIRGLFDAHGAASPLVIGLGQGSEHNSELSRRSWTPLFCRPSRAGTPRRP